MAKQHRFTMYQNIIYDDGNIINSFGCMKLLNQLNDENKQLKKDLEYYKTLTNALYEYIDKKDDLNITLTLKEGVE